ncbi:MAG: hypothetical protein VW684_14820 [Betaproteobacteria bacterium]
MYKFRTEPKFEDYLETLNANRDYVDYLIDRLVRLGQEGNLPPTIGAFHIEEIESLFIEIIAKIDKLKVW